MSLLSEAVKNKEFDTRTIERKLAKGLMSESEVNKHIKTLKDDEDAGQYVDISELYESIQGKSQLRDNH